MDLQMPVLNGYQAIQKIRENGNPSTPRPIIIALTANELDAELTAALAGEHDDFLSKPIHEDRLLAKLAEHLDIRYRYQPLALTSTSVADSSLKTKSTPSSSSFAISPFTISQTSRENLKKMVGENETYLANYISDCIASLPLLLKRLIAAIEVQDFAEICLAAHSIKGTVLVFGADRLTMLCQTIEEWAKQQKPSFDKRQIQTLELELESLLAALKLELSTEP